MVREFVVRAGCEREFTQVYGRDGVWDRLLRLGRNGYQGCELIEREEVLGMFYQNDRDSGPDGETGLVPA